MEDLNAALNGNKPCLVLVYSTGCGACSQFSPMYDFACAKHHVPESRKVFIQADALSKPDFSKLTSPPYNVKGYPTVMVVGGGQVLESKFGRKSEIMDDVARFMQMGARPVNSQPSGGVMLR